MPQTASRSLPPKEPHVPSPWLGTDAERSSLSTTAIKPSQNWLIALKRRMGEHLLPAWAILTTRVFFLSDPPELLPLKKTPVGKEVEDGWEEATPGTEEKGHLCVLTYSPVLETLFWMSSLFHPRMLSVSACCPFECLCAVLSKPSFLN